MSKPSNADRKAAAAAYDKADARYQRAMHPHGEYVRESKKALNRAVKSGNPKAVAAAGERFARAERGFGRTYDKHAKDLAAAQSKLSKAQSWWRR